MIIDTNDIIYIPSTRTLMNVYLVMIMTDCIKQYMGMPKFLSDEWNKKSTQNVMFYITILLFALGIKHALEPSNINTVFTHILLLKILVEMKNCRHKTEINIYNK